MTIKRVLGRNEQLPFCCGITDIGDFTRYNKDFWDINNEKLNKLPTSGTGFYTAAFINTNICKDAYTHFVN